MIWVLESGASLNVPYTMGSAFYLKPGASVHTTGALEQCAIIKAPGSSINFTKDDTLQRFSTIIECDALNFDYKAAPQKGIEILQKLGYLSVENNLNNSNISIYPNPSDGIFRIQSNDDGIEKSAKIYDMFGNVIYENKFTGKANIDISNHPGGYYMIQIIEGKNVYYSKFIKY